MKPKTFTTSMNRKVCWEDGFKQGKQQAEDIKQNQLADHFQSVSGSSPDTFNLSELWQTFKQINPEAIAVDNFEDALKEFIRLIKEELSEDPSYPRKTIDRLSGDKLIEEKKQ
jgi:transcriptional regulator CtsR